jgi:endonuclease/exonuclease/phosphatase family metal-dependent hydrolase
VRVLQLNLCSSGIAGCYTGRAPAEAAAVIRAEKPDLVTLNEVCEDDVSVLQHALADVVPGGAVTSAFQAARDARTGDPYRCRNGRHYDIGIVSRWPPAPGTSTDRGIYPAQDPEDPEQRAWLCLDVAADPAVAVCTTHLAYTRRDVAGAQCRYLFGTVIADRRARGPGRLHWCWAVT